MVALGKRTQVTGLEEKLGEYRDLRNIRRIDELDIEPFQKFIFTTEQDVLWPIVDEANIIVVPGAFYGDEGKGKIIHALSMHPDIDLIVRANSGENAGHTVIHDGERYIFHIVPSAVMTGKQCAIGENAVVDPVTMMADEIQPLIDSGVDYNLVIGNVHLVGPHHKLYDLMNGRNASTLRGMSAVHAAKSLKRGLRLEDVFNDRDEMVARLQEDLNLYEGFKASHSVDDAQLLERCHEVNELSGSKRIADHVIGFLQAEQKADYLVSLYTQTIVDNPLFPDRADVHKIARDNLAKGIKILVETAQGYKLTNGRSKHARFGTSAMTSALGTLSTLGINIARYKVKVINVDKGPISSRVGQGPNPAGFVNQSFFDLNGIHSLTNIADHCTDFDQIQEHYFKCVDNNGILKPEVYTNGDAQYFIDEAMAISSAREYGEFGSTTGKPRICGWHDLVSLKQVMDEQGPNLVLSAFDRGDVLDNIGLVVGYVVHAPEGRVLDSDGHKYRRGDIITPQSSHYPSDTVLQYCKPIVRVMPGWKETPIAAGKRNKSDPLPKQAQDVLSVVQQLTGAKIIAIGNGPDTNDLIYIKEK